jgi:hypothetical protein
MLPPNTAPEVREMMAASQRTSAYAAGATTSARCTPRPRTSAPPSARHVRDLPLAVISHTVAFPPPFERP